MKIIVYGLGHGRLLLEKTLKNNHEIIGYTDSYSQIECFNNVKFYKVEELVHSEFDYILIAIGGTTSVMPIINNLVDKYRIERTKIFDFYKLYKGEIPYQKVDRVMKNPNIESYNGIILGISHAELGINPQNLNGRYCNLAVSGQDIYYNLLTLKHCINNYYNKVKNLEYAIIDMFDYNYFNYDVSLTHNAINYYSWGGYMGDEHNYKMNKRFSLSSNEELKKMGIYIPVLSECEITLKELLFNNIYSLNNYEEFNDFPNPKLRIHKIEKNPEMEQNMLYPSFAQRRFEKTISENIIYFEELLIQLKKINPVIKIIILLMPRYYTVEKIHENLYVNWKKEFEDIIHTYQKKYNYQYLNLKNYEPINTNNNFYFDIAHFNYSGATAFTSLLNKYIEDYK